MNYCKYCGMKLESNYRVCPNCGRLVEENSAMYNQMPIYQQQMKSTKGKDIASVVLNLLAFYFAYVNYTAREELVQEAIKQVGELNVAFIIGALLWQIAFVAIAMGLSLSSRKQEAKTINLVNIILAAINIAFIIMEFALYTTYMN